MSLKKVIDLVVCTTPHCGFNKKVYVPDYHNKKCPKCKQSILVDDYDLHWWKTQNVKRPNKRTPKKVEIINIASKPVKIPN